MSSSRSQQFTVMIGEMTKGKKIKRQREILSIDDDYYVWSFSNLSPLSSDSSHGSDGERWKQLKVACRKISYSFSLSRSIFFDGYEFSVSSYTSSSLAWTGRKKRVSSSRHIDKDEYHKQTHNEPTKDPFCRSFLIFKQSTMSERRKLRKFGRAQKEIPEFKTIMLHPKDVSAAKKKTILLAGREKCEERKSRNPRQELKSENPYTTTYLLGDKNKS